VLRASRAGAERGKEKRDRAIHDEIFGPLNHTEDAQ
jgi:hypothetical protein